MALDTDALRGPCQTAVSGHELEASERSRSEVEAVEGAKGKLERGQPVASKLEVAPIEWHAAEHTGLEM